MVIVNVQQDTKRLNFTKMTMEQGSVSFYVYHHVVNVMTTQKQNVQNASIAR